MRSVAGSKFSCRPAICGRLERHAAHARLLDRVLDDLADLVVVEALLERDDERRGQPEVVEPVDGFAPDAREICAAQRLERQRPERVELEVHLEARRVGREALREGGVLRDADAVRVEHEVPDGPLAAGVEDVPELRVDRRLSARDLEHVGLALALDERVEHELDLLHRAVPPIRGRGPRVARRAGEVAAVGDFQDGEARVLLVVRAQAAVVRAAPRHRRREPARHLARLHVVADAAVVLGVARDEHFLLLAAAMPAPLEHVHRAVLQDDLGLHAAQAPRAQAQREIVVGVRALAVRHQAAMRCGANRRPANRRR